jgi:broad specificity phosphatase PhoE
VAAEFGDVLKPDTPHANAWTIGDLTRTLTEKGRDQAKLAAGDTGWFAPFAVRAVVSSEATRAIDTKDIMTNGRFEKGSAGNLTMHTLHPSRSETPDCEKMFDALGYGTLATYYANTDVETSVGTGKGREVFREYIDKASAELARVIAQASKSSVFPPEGSTLAVFGHAVFMNAVAVAVAEAMGIKDGAETIGAFELGEAEGIVCESSGSVRLAVQDAQ